jgi:hypothetical protein
MGRWSFLLVALTLVACEGGTGFEDHPGSANPGIPWLGGFPAVPTGDGPSAIVADDFDGDGLLDVVTANNTGNSVSVLLGNGDGTFAPRVDYPWTSMVGPIVGGDFDGDGKPDFAIASWNAPSVAVFLNQGKGIFAPQPEIPVAPFVVAMVAADLDADGALDLALASQEPGTVTALYGRGNGSFAAHVEIQTTTQARGLAVADFNHDGRLDLAVGGYGDTTLTILLGANHRSLASGFTLTDSTIDCASSIAAGEFTGDNRTDLVVTHGTCNRGSPGSLLLLAGAGNGSFSVAGKNYDVPAGPLETPDVDGDGRNDLTIADGYNLYVFYGQPSGEPAAPVKYPPPVALGFARVFGDFDGDGKTDVVSADPGTNSVLFVPGNSGRTFAVPPHYGSTWNIGQVLARDLDGDGRLDVVAISREYQVGVFPGNGNGTLGASTEYDVAKEASGLAIGDVDGDGKNDVVVTRDTSNTATILLGRDGGALVPGAQMSFGQVASCPVLGDLNGDGRLDLVVRYPDQGQVGVWLGAGDGTFAEHATVALERDPRYWLPIACLALQDLDGDQVLDLVAVDGDAAVARGQVDGSFGAFTRYPMGDKPDKIVVGDLNGDAIADLVTTSLHGVSVALGNGDGSFAAVATYPGGSSWNMTFGAALADLDGDSHLDLIAGRDLGRLQVFFGDGTGAFPRSALYSGAGALAVGDMNGDGRPDVVVADWVGDALTVLLNKPL